MKLAAITPLILTKNEEANLYETLCCLKWAKSILIVDSYSSDATLSIAAEFEQVQVVQREFDHFAEQCNFGISKITSPWTLSLDADYRCPPEFVEELGQISEEYDGYEATFKYMIYGRSLRACLYPPRTVLYRTDLATYKRDGHAHKVNIDGKISRLRTPLIHDDKKPLSEWFHSQIRYTLNEEEKLRTTTRDRLGWKDRIRTKILFAPALVLFYCLFRKGLIFDGWRGIYYSLQRTFAELALSLILLDTKLRAD